MIRGFIFMPHNANLFQHFVLSNQKKRFVMTGQLTGGAYYRAYGQDKKNFPTKAVQVVRKNKGLVYVA